MPQMAKMSRFSQVLVGALREGPGLELVRGLEVLVFVLVDILLADDGLHGLRVLVVHLEPHQDHGGALSDEVADEVDLRDGQSPCMGAEAMAKLQ